MPINVTILGLGRVGRSLGLALMKRDDLRLTGYDTEADLARTARRAGALHRAEWNLPNAVAKADLILMASPLAEQPEILKAIAPELRAGCVVASVAPLLGQPLAWAAQYLTGEAGRYFVASHPILNPALLHSGDTGPSGAREDLFKGGLWALAPAPNCAPEALKLMADLTRLLEALPYFVDPLEHDGLAAATGALPAILAWVLFQAAAASPGWPETRKVADRSFATATVALDEAEFASLRYNRENVLHYLDAALAGLQDVRRLLVEAGDDGGLLQQTLADMAEQRLQWLLQRQKGEWEPPGQVPAEMLSSGEMVSRLFVGGLFQQRKGKDKDKSGE